MEGGGWERRAGRLGRRSPEKQRSWAASQNLGDGSGDGGGSKERRCTGERTASVRDEGW